MDAELEATRYSYYIDEDDSIIISEDRLKASGLHFVRRYRTAGSSVRPPVISTPAKSSLNYPAVSSSFRPLATSTPCLSRVATQNTAESTQQSPEYRAKGEQTPFVGVGSQPCSPNCREVPQQVKNSLVYFSGANVGNAKPGDAYNSAPHFGNEAESAPRSNTEKTGVDPVQDVSAESWHSVSCDAWHSSDQESFETAHSSMRPQKSSAALRSRRSLH